jgi:hypothetical protein
VAIGPRPVRRAAHLDGLRGVHAVAGYQDVRRIPPEIVDAYGVPVFGYPPASRSFARLIAALSSADLAAPSVGTLRRDLTSGREIRMTWQPIAPRIGP